MLRIPNRYSDCLPNGFNDERPCPFTCKHRTPYGQCTLDIAKDGPMSIADIAVEMGLSEESIKTILETAFKKLKRHGVLREFYER